MFTNFIYIGALIASFLWFSAAFHYFGFKHFAAAKVLVPRSARTSPIFPTVAAGMRFLGGMNAALALLSLGLLIIAIGGWPIFTQPIERGFLLFVLAAAHFSQFIFNVPILRNGERQGETYWNVLTGPMFFIFAMDAAQFCINILAGIIQFF